MLRDRVPGVRIAHFSHTPWAPVDYYRILPDESGRAVLDGMLGADHAGFLSQRWASAFLDCCEALLGAQVDRDTQRVIHRGHVTSVGVHPLGVDAPTLRERAHAADAQAGVDALEQLAGDRKLIVRIDRTELSKNILRGLLAYRELLATRPEWHGRVVHVAFAYPSRSSVPGYREYTEQVERLAAEINAEFATPDWQPLVLEVKDDYPRSLAASRVADVLVVNPIRDGMNLVAEEGPVLSDRGCALVLSREAGAASLLGSDALLVNPYDVSATASAIHQALIMPEEERRRRCTAMANVAAAHSPSVWLTEQLDALG
jgi:trehalose 6-phosphate synthase